MEYAKRILAVNQDWEKELQDLTSYNEGELNIAFPLMRSSCMVPQIMEIFHEQYPGIRVNLRKKPMRSRNGCFWMISWILPSSMKRSRIRNWNTRHY